MEEEKKDIKPIDFAQVSKKLWAQRKLYYKVLPATLIITYLLMVCIPRYYRCEISLAPETSGTSISGSIESLASSFGLGSLGKLNSDDAIYAEIYPEVVSSKNFIAFSNQSGSLNRLANLTITNNIRFIHGKIELSR